MAFIMDGVLVGHAQDAEALTGCSVILFPRGAVGGGEVRGGAPGTRETDLLGCMNLVEEINAILVAGGSAFGLAAADGVMSYLEEKGMGFNTVIARVPIIPAAVIFDLSIGDSTRRPDAQMGYLASLSASEDLSAQGNVGAGMGATVGKVLGDAFCMKGGWGFSAFESEEGFKVVSFAAVNAFGDVVGEDGRIIAGARNPEGGFLNTELFLEGTLGRRLNAPGNPNTTVGTIVTNARLNKAEVNWVARMGHNGLARALAPSHTKLDGDTVFAAALGEVEVPADLVGIIGARLLAEAIRNAALQARGIAGIPAACDLAGGR